MEKQIIIGICDDNPMAIQQLKKMTEAYLIKEDVEAVVGKEAIKMRAEKSLSRLEEELDKRLFFRVNREYLVNFAFIKIDHKGTILIGQKKIKVSRRNKKEFEQRYRDYDLNYRG